MDTGAATKPGTGQGIGQARRLHTMLRVFDLEKSLDFGRYPVRPRTERQMSHAWECDEAACTDAFGHIHTRRHRNDLILRDVRRGGRDGRHALRADVDGLSRNPGGTAQQSALRHHVAIGSDALAMKGGRSDAPLAHVEAALAGDEAFAQQDLHAALGALFDEGGGLGDQDLADQLWIIDENDVVGAELVMRNNTVLTDQVLKQQDRVPRAEKAAEQIQRQVALKSRRKSIVCLFAKAAQSLPIRPASVQRRAGGCHRL